MKNFAPRTLTATEYAELTRQPPDNSAALSQARVRAAQDRHDRVQQFKANVAAALASPEVADFKQFLSTLNRDTRLGLLQELIDDDN